MGLWPTGNVCVFPFLPLWAVFRNNLAAEVHGQDITRLFGQNPANKRQSHTVYRGEGAAKLAGG